MKPDPAAPRDHLPEGWLERPATRRLVLAEMTSRAAVRRRKRRRLLVAGACTVLLFGVGLFTFRQPTVNPVVLAWASEPKRQTLPDGSVVELKGDADFTTHFDGVARRVTLKRGTAHFEVNKDPARPFIVSAGSISVRAVGTAFSVELADSTIEVLVTEGRVAVDPATASDPASTVAMVEAGTGVVVSLATPANHRPLVRSVSEAAFDEKLAWRVHHLEFSGTPLAEAVGMLNRHNRLQFVIADPSLAGVRLSGVIRTDRIEGVLQLLEQDCGVRAERAGDSEIVLRRSR